MSASEVANKIKEEATIVKEKAESLVASISVDQKEAESKLLAAKPALDAAEAALQVKFAYSYLQRLYLKLLCNRQLKLQILQQCENWESHHI